MIKIGDQVKPTYAQNETVYQTTSFNNGAWQLTDATGNVLYMIEAFLTKVADGFDFKESIDDFANQFGNIFGGK